jgi:SAM-dependent methyltransferase
MASEYKLQMIEWLDKKMIPGGSVLSIGCQNDDRKYFKSFEAHEFKTLDFNPANNPDIVHDMNTDLFPGEFENEWIGRFDFVLALDLFEYIYDPVMAHKNLNLLLKPGGVLFVTYPFVYPQHEPAGTDYLRYAPDGVRKLLTNAGFEIMEVECKKNDNGTLQNYYHADRLKCRAGADHDITGVMIIAKKQ